MTIKICSECEKPALARELCAMHYARWARPYREAGIPLPPKPPRLREKPAQCRVTECPNFAKTLGLCAKHYWRWHKYGSLEIPTKPDNICSVKDCPKKAASRGWCEMHYTRWLRNGDPLIVQQIRGDDRTRFNSYVDRSEGSDACHPWTGGQCTGGYGQISIGGKLILAHVMAWELEYDDVKPPGTDMDHECHNQAVRKGSCQPGKCLHRLCCNPAHLSPKTRKKHRDDTVQWEMPKGGRGPLTSEEKTAIKELLAKGHTGRSIARQFHISQGTVTHIKHGRRG